MDSALSASDIALLGNNGEWGGNSFMWIFALLILANGGFGGWGNRGFGDYGQFATAASQQEILFGQQFQGLDNKIDRLGNGIADATFSLNNSIKDGNTMVAGRVVDEGRALQQQLSDCCCENKSAIAQVRYDMANFANATQTAIHAEGEATRNMLQQNKIESLQAQINNLQMQNAMAGVVRYPSAWTYNAGASPFCNSTPCSCTGLATI